VVTAQLQPAGQAQDRESSPAKDRRSTTVLHDLWSLNLMLLKSKSAQYFRCVAFITELLDQDAVRPRSSDMTTEIMGHQIITLNTI